MKKLLLLLLFALVGLSNSWAWHKDLFFGEKTSGVDKDLCVTAASPTELKNSLDKNGAKCESAPKAHVRLRFINPPQMSSAKFGFYLERPFFVIDGIYLGTDSLRTLDDYQGETDAFGIPALLSNLGYTPVLVQFSETVQNSLEKNAEMFRGVLEFLNSNKLVEFPDKAHDGFVVLGISQGGILGRYGSYLYDKSRGAGSAPVRLYASLDSPHQGAVMPRGLVATIDFWAKTGSADAAEAFQDLITADGAKDLLLYDTKNSKNDFPLNMDANRFLFGDYRKAAEYKGFPSVLISQGQIKGQIPKHHSMYFNLNRAAVRSGETWGRAESRMSPSDNENGEFSKNHMYEYLSSNTTSTRKGNASMDFVQGSTYPFAKTIYEALREGMESAIPEGLSYKIGVGPLTFKTLKFDAVWDADTLYEPSSTFIPTVSALDLKCGGNLAIRGACAFSENGSSLKFESPGSASTGTFIFAVDKTHPRYEEAVSGRHIELPGSGKNKNVVSGMQTDIWRVMCELAKVDFDSTKGTFRNPDLLGLFSPKSNCMDLSLMPDIIKNAGVESSKKFAYARYDYNDKASENDDTVFFSLPAGWNKSALFDNGTEIPEGSFFEAEVKVDLPNANWMKAELMIQKTKKIASMPIQMGELSVNPDGAFHTVRWHMPTAKGALANYRWFRLVLNSAGGIVSIANPRLVVNSKVLEDKPMAIPSKEIFPNNDYTFIMWSDKLVYSSVYDENRWGQSFEFGPAYNGFHVDMKQMYSLDSYSDLVVEYFPGTCQHTAMYFDAKNDVKSNLANGSLQNGIVVKNLHLSDIIDTNFTPAQSLSGHRLSAKSMIANEKCVISRIYLK
ncbi:MAG: hypothetical protein HUK21_07665 [Fibrobacteraceae bacterium]|nr:hypothetical protein [Fibrobacteraceae bacterium]